MASRRVRAPARAQGVGKEGEEGLPIQPQQRMGGWSNDEYGNVRSDARSNQEPHGHRRFFQRRHAQLNDVQLVFSQSSRLSIAIIFPEYC